MTITTELLNRNQHFAADFTASGMPVLPKLRTVVLTCVDARVDPAHVLGLQLGDAVIMRNNGARVTREVVEEIATLAFMVANMDGEDPGPFEVIVMQHTQCGAERFADPVFQSAIKSNLGIDVSAIAITDHSDSLKQDIQRLCQAKEIPGHIVVSGFIYDVHDGLARQIVEPAKVSSRQF